MKLFKYDQFIKENNFDDVKNSLKELSDKLNHMANLARQHSE